MVVNQTTTWTRGRSGGESDLCSSGTMNCCQWWTSVQRGVAQSVDFFPLSGECCVSHRTHCSVFAGICFTLYRSKLRLYTFWKQYKALFVIF